MATLATNVDWTKVQFERANLQEQLIRNSVEAAKQFTDFLNNGARLPFVEPRILTIDRSKPFDPNRFSVKSGSTYYTQKGWTIWKGPLDGDGLDGEEEQNSHSIVLKEIDVSKVKLVLVDGNVIRGNARFYRLKKYNYICLDIKILQTLLENQQFIPSQWKKETNDEVTLITFDGTILRSPEGLSHVLVLWWSDSTWSSGLREVKRSWYGRNSLSAVLVN
jgi:hypothetical protein